MARLCLWNLTKGEAEAFLDWLEVHDWPRAWLAAVAEGFAVVWQEGGAVSEANPPVFFAPSDRSLAPLRARR